MSRQNTNNSAGIVTGEQQEARNLGSDYQETQKRTLTKWVNSQLSNVHDHIDHIETDLRDGKRLLRLLSVLSNEPVPKPERGNMRIHQLSNVAQALDFLSSQLHEDVLPDIGNEAIVNGDLKKTLALIYFIMIKYQIQPILEDKELMSTYVRLAQRNARRNCNPLTPSVFMLRIPLARNHSSLLLHGQ